MKFRMICLCLCTVLLLSGCQFVPDEYISVAPHTDSFSQPDSEETGTISNYTELKNAILAYVLEGVEQAVLTSNAYTGNITADFEMAKDYITKDNASGAYLVESIEPEIARAGSYFRLNLTINYRRNPDMLDDVQAVRGPAGVESALKLALEDYSEDFLLRVSGYEAMDFEKMIDRCYESSLTAVMEKPKVSATVYPNDGDLRILEFRFTYPRSVATLNLMQSTVDTIMDAAYGYVSYGQNEMEKAMLLYSFLSERHSYIEGSSETPVYSLLYEGIADSRAFAAVYNAMCIQAGLHSTVVHGVKDGKPYDWNILELNSGIWHVDTFADELNGLREMQLLTDDQMYGYEWDWEAYPACIGATQPPAPVNEDPAPVPEETPPPVPDEPDNTPAVEPLPPADEDETPDNTQLPEENSGVPDISS